MNQKEENDDCPIINCFVLKYLTLGAVRKRRLKKSEWGHDSKF